METCLDIKGNEINSVALGADGVVYGLDNNNLITYTLSAECCERLGYNFNPDDALCYWSDVKNNANINVIINSDGESGGLFVKQEESKCKFNLGLDYLFVFKCDKKCDLSFDNLKNLKINLILQTIDLDGNIDNFDSINLINFSDLNSFNNSNSGVYFEKKTKYCQYFFNNIEQEFISNNYVIINESFNSSWVNYNKIYDETQTELLNNKKIRIGFNIENLPCGLSIKVDNIKLFSNCLEKSKTKTFIIKNPSFSFERIADNKKTWLNDDLNRNHDLKYRETNYQTNEEELILNSKELDLHFSSNNGIEHDFWVFAKNNPNLINSINIDGVDFNKLLGDDWTKSNNLKDFTHLLISKLVDVKNSRTLSDYPTLKLLYYRYVNSFQYVAIQSNAFTYNDMINFIDILDNYWLDLIEQFIPSTSIWESTIKISNSIFDSQKFIYKKYNIHKIDTNLCVENSCEDSILSNGDLSENLVGWDFVDDTWYIGGGMARYNGSVIYQNPTIPITQDILIPGKKYRIKLKVDLSTSDNSGGGLVHFVKVYAGTNYRELLSSGVYEFELIANGTLFSIEANDSDNPCGVDGYGCDYGGIGIGEVCVYELICDEVQGSTNNDILLSHSIYVEEVNLSDPSLVSNYNKIGIYQINDGSEFYSSINIITPGVNNLSGDIIMLSESKDSSNQTL